MLHVPCDSPIVYCGFAINAGTRDELPHEHGMAHFVEHMLFKGTEKRHSRAVLSRLESVGGQIDAYTNKEETYVYATVPKCHLGRAIELLNDIVFHSTFPQHELEHERDVVLEEISSYNDSPAESIYDDFEDILFNQSSLGHNILGNEQSLQTITTETMKAFVQRCYTTDNIVFFCHGDVDFKRLIRLVEKYCDAPATKRQFRREKPATYRPQELRIDKETCQLHCMIGNRTFELTHEKRYVMLLLNNILGGPFMSSRLNLAVRERNGLAYTIESLLTTYTDTGVWSVYVGCDARNEKRCLQLIHNELQKLCEQPLSPQQLRQAKEQFRGQSLILNENHENLILSLAKYFLQTGECLSDDEIDAKIDAITAEEIQQMAAELFDKQKLTELVYF